MVYSTNGFSMLTILLRKKMVQYGLLKPRAVKVKEKIKILTARLRTNSTLSKSTPVIRNCSGVLFEIKIIGFILIIQNLRRIWQMTIGVLLKRYFNLVLLVSKENRN